MAAVNDTPFDFAIIGGGAVGTSLALALSKVGFDVALLDEKPPQERCMPEHDNRIFALATGTQVILERLNIWPHAADHASPIAHIHVSNKGSFGAARLAAKDYQLDALGYMLASVDLQKALNTTVEQQPLTQFYPAKFKALSLSHPAHVIFDHQGEEQTLCANYVIAADGANSSVRQFLNLGAQKRYFGQQALVTKVQLTKPHQATAYERFIDDGAIAMLPFGEKQCALIWSLNDDDAKRLLALDDAAFLTHLQTTFGYRLGKLESISQRMSYPLIECLSDHVVYQDRVIFVGNASQSLHPIAAQGFNLALRNIALLVDVLLQVKQNKLTMPEALNQYQSLQSQDLRNTRCFTNTLVQFFSNEGLSRSKTVRGLALAGVELCPPVKKHLIQGMMKGVERLTRAIDDT